MYMTYVFYPQLQDKEWLVQQIKIKSMHQIAIEIGCSTSAVSYAVHDRFGLTMPLHGGFPQPKLRRFPKLHDEQWLRESLQRKSVHFLAQEIGCSYGGVINAVRKFKIVLPGRTKQNIFRENSPREKAKKSLGGRFGANAAHWRGGRLDPPSRKYVWLYRPHHPRADSRGYVMEHRLVMEEKLGRVLEQHERVHHINNNGKDNRPENLELYSSTREHFKRHFDAVGREVELEKEIERLRQIIEDLGGTY